MENLDCAARHGRVANAYAHRASLSAIALIAAALLLIVAAPKAEAAQSFPQLSKFCPTGTAGGQCGQASGLATSPLDGHLFEVDTLNNRIQEFTPWGEFVKTFGWSVVASGPGNKPRNEIQQLTVTATGGSFKLRYAEGPSAPTLSETAVISYQPGAAPTAIQVQEALINATTFGSFEDPFAPGDLAVSGPAGGPWSIEFIGRYADLDFGGGANFLEPKGEGLTGGGATAVLTTTQPGGNYEVCVPANGDVCRAGSPGRNPGQLGGNPGSQIGPQGVAVDSSGDIYVVDRQNHRVQKYGPEGAFLLMFGGGVNQTTGEDVCTSVQIEGGDVCGPGTVGAPGPGEGEFGPWEVKPLAPALGNYISVGPDDTIYVGDTNRIQRFGVDGAFKGQISGAVLGEIVQSLAVGPDGSIYATFANPSAARPDLTSKANVRRLDGSGSQIAQLPAANPRGLATDSKGNVFVVDVDASNSGAKVLGFTAAGAPIDLDPNGSGTALGEGLLQQSTGIATASPPTCGLASTTLAVSSWAVVGGSDSINLFGGAPDPAVCPQPAVPPTIESQFASSVDTTSAAIRARINPRFWPDTRYYLQYGLGKCSEGGCNLTKPASPGVLLTEDVTNTGVATKAILLTGLERGTSYHYRFVAQSGGGGPVSGEEQTFRTARTPSGESGCPNDAFRSGPSANLPDCRAYELVSPLDKSNGDIARSGEYSFAQADPTGQRMTFSSFRSFGDPAGAPLVNQYLGERQDSGWATTAISPPRSVPSLYPLGATSEGNYFKAFSEDLCGAWVLQDTERVLTSDAPAGVPNLYRRSNCGSPGYDLITTSLPPGVGPVPYETRYFPTVQGSSDDMSSTVFRANAALAVSAGGPRPAFECPTKGSGAISYRWLRDGAPIGGATQSTYTYATADIGKTVQCQVTTTESGKISLVASETLLVSPVPSPTPPNPGFKNQDAADLPGAPTITGAPVVGSILTCQPGPWNGAPSFTYQWFRDGSSIGGATNSSYAPLPSDEGGSLQCRVTGMNDGGAAISFSRSVTVAANLPLATSPPAITGTPEAGEILTCTDGTWQGGPAFTYQWLRNGAPIGGAVTSEYTLVAADEGKAIQCRVNAANSEATVAATSPRVVVAPPPGVAPPSRLTAGGITGTPEIGETLICNPGSWQGASSFSYQWLRNGAVIGGASSDEYTLAGADEGGAIQCQATATNPGGSVVSIDGDQASRVYAAPPAAPRTLVSTNNGSSQLYVSTGATLRLVSVMPNGTATTASATAGTAWSVFTDTANAREDAVYRAVSDDGTRVVWSATTTSSLEGRDRGAGSLYLRLNATEPQSAMSGGKCTEAATKACTVAISASTEARFISANPEASRVVYMTGKANPKVGLELFIGEVDLSGSEPTVDSEPVAEGVRGVVGVSEDANRIYFVSNQVLTSDENSEGAEAEAGKPNLYLFDAGTAAVEFVASLAEADAIGGEARPFLRTPIAPVSASPSRRSSRVTPDGLHMTFTATATPTGYDNSDTASGAPDAEVYLYDAAAAQGDGRLLCLSCNPSEGRPVGRLINEGVAGPDDDLWAAAIVPGWSSQHQPSRALSDSGGRVFFTAYDSLVPGDGNGRADVYQWEEPGEGGCTEGSSSYSEENGGCIRLISSGQSSEDAEFFDATPSGSDVFFVTQASLVAQDYGLRDIYDARVGGGFPTPATPGEGCQGEGCQNPPPSPPERVPPSNTFAGPGNVKKAKPPKHCPKGKHKAKKNGKTVCVKSKKKATKKQGKRSSRQSRGGAR